MWDFQPTGFFTRLLVRLMHMQMIVAVSWQNAGVICSCFGDEVGFLELKREDKYLLEVYYFEKYFKRGQQKPTVFFFGYSYVVFEKSPKHSFTMTNPVTGAYTLRKTKPSCKT